MPGLPIELTNSSPTPETHNHTDWTLTLTPWEKYQFALAGGLKACDTLKLAQEVKKGSKDYAADKWAAKKLAIKYIEQHQAEAKAEPKAEPAPEAVNETSISTTEKIDKEFSLPNPRDASQSGHTERLYDSSSWFTSFRLTLLSWSRVDDRLGLSSFRLLRSPFLGGPLSIFGYLSLTYGFELLIDLAMLFKAMLPKANDTTTWKQRLINAFNKGNRPARMRNAALWLTINTIFLLTVPVVAIACNIAGFVLDVAHEVYKYYKQVKPYDELIKKVKDKAQELSHTGSCIASRELTRVVNKLAGKRSKTKSDRQWTILVAGGLLIGAVMVFSPMLPALVALAGACVMAVTQTANLMRRISVNENVLAFLDKISSYFNKHKVKKTSNDLTADILNRLEEAKRIEATIEPTTVITSRSEAPRASFYNLSISIEIPERQSDSSATYTPTSVSACHSPSPSSSPS